MPHEVINIRPEPLGGHGLSEEIALALAATYDRVAEEGGKIVAGYTVHVAQAPKGTDEIFLVADIPTERWAEDREPVTTIFVGYDR